MNGWLHFLRRGVPCSAVALLAGLIVLLSSEPALAETTDGSSRALSFEDSAHILAQRSAAMAGARARVRAARDHADSLKGLRLPMVSLDAQQLRYQKTIELSLGDLRGQALGAANGILGDIQGAGVPGVSAGDVTSVVNEVRSALPGMFPSLPDSVGVRSRRTLFHPTITAIMPLYAGGAITAAKEGARASVQVAQAQADHAGDALQLTLVQAYFGLVLATQSEQVARDTRDGFDHHLYNAGKLEEHGQISRARLLQVQVARDGAQRTLDKAEGNRRTAADTLESLLGSDHPIRPVTGLFVSSTPLEPVDSFIRAAEVSQPRLRQAEAAVTAAEQATRLAHSKWLPSFYAFGKYNLNREHELATEPDWVVGIGMHYTLLASVNRSKSASAARARQQAAEAAQRQVRDDIRVAITKAWNLVETARRQFLSLDSSIAAATESLRVQQISFREGVAAASEVIDARNVLAQVRTQRAATAYKYDLALASLLLASGQSQRFPRYLHLADWRVPAS